MANDAGGVVRPMGLLYPCQRGNTGQPGMSAFQVNGSPRAYIASSLRERTSTVHPHACGEHLPSGYCSSSASGSSPRMWGTRLGAADDPCACRFIPTHVGNTTSVFALPTTNTVHPHACGEHTSDITERASMSGSSPRMWGTQQGLAMGLAFIRFIPTHVGNTIHLPRNIWNVSVHPHACGEHQSESSSTCMRPGSSPRMWGTRSTL